MLDRFWDAETKALTSRTPARFSRPLIASGASSDTGPAFRSHRVAIARSRAVHEAGKPGCIMAEQFEDYFAMLEELTSEELDESTRELALHGKQNEARSIAHIAEIAKRELHLKLGYKNLFDSCCRGLNYSEGSVFRRTQVAAVCRRFPAILEALFSGRLHLTAASLIAPHLTEANVEELIAKAEGKTKRELEKYLVTLAPKKEFAPSVRKQPAGEPALLGESSKVGAPEEGKPGMIWS